MRNVSHKLELEYEDKEAVKKNTSWSCVCSQVHKAHFKQALESGKELYSSETEYQA